jgi:hypothetical protein
MRRRALFFPIILTVALSTGCASQKALLLGEEFSSPGRALSILQEKNEAAGVLQGVSTLTAVTAEARYSVKLALIAERPSSLRIEEMPLIGLPDLYLSANRQQLKVFFPKEGKFYVGKPTGENLSKFLPWAVEVEDFLALLFGMPPPRIAGTERLEGRVDDDLYRIDAFSGGRKYASLWIDPVEHRLVRTESLSEKGERIYDVHLSSYGPVGNFIIPQEITLSFFKPKMTDVIIRHESIEIVPAVSEDLFDLEIPAGITPLQLD